VWLWGGPLAAARGLPWPPHVPRPHSGTGTLVVLESGFPCCYMVVSMVVVRRIVATVLVVPEPR
jgi:hypothetical protein